ncbi:MAG: hypothetical protein ACFFD4_34370 [Candidatus Odinarchaeota archaeon]
MSPKLVETSRNPSNKSVFNQNKIVWAGVPLAVLDADIFSIFKIDNKKYMTRDDLIRKLSVFVSDRKAIELIDHLLDRELLVKLAIKGKKNYFLSHHSISFTEAEIKFKDIQFYNSAGISTEMYNVCVEENKLPSLITDRVFRLVEALQLNDEEIAKKSSGMCGSILEIATRFSEDSNSEKKLTKTCIRLNLTRESIAKMFKTSVKSMHLCRNYLFSNYYETITSTLGTRYRVYRSGDRHVRIENITNILRNATNSMKLNEKSRDFAWVLYDSDNGSEIFSKMNNPLISYSSLCASILDLTATTYTDLVQEKELHAEIKKYNLSLNEIARIFGISRETLVKCRNLLVEKCFDTITGELGKYSLPTIEFDGNVELLSVAIQKKLNEIFEKYNLNCPQVTYDNMRKMARLLENNQRKNFKNIELPLEMISAIVFFFSFRCFDDLSTGEILYFLIHKYDLTSYKIASMSGLIPIDLKRELENFQLNYRDILSETGKYHLVKPR